MKFTLHSNRVESLSINNIDKTTTSKNKFNFQYRCLHSADKKREFVIAFDFHLESKNGFDLNLEHHFLFKSAQNLTAEFLSSHFTTMNAPAIAYPYLRAFVATVLLNAGLDSIALPAVNFVELSKQKQQEALSGNE
jgi:preprotein translocase subunit SecB